MLIKLNKNSNLYGISTSISNIHILEWKINKKKIGYIDKIALSTTKLKNKNNI